MSPRRLVIVMVSLVFCGVLLVVWMVKVSDSSLSTVMFSVVFRSVSMSYVLVNGALFVIS